MLQNWSYTLDLDAEHTLDVVVPVFDLYMTSSMISMKALNLNNRANLEHLSHWWWVLEEVELGKMIAQHWSLNKLSWECLRELWWVPTFSVTWLLHWECPESTNAWALCALISLKCLDVRPSFCLPMNLSWEWFSASLERIADLSSLMKCLIANESTDAWVMAYNSASALECETDAWVRLVEDRLTENNVMSEPLVDLLDLWHPAQSESE